MMAQANAAGDKLAKQPSRVSNAFATAEKRRGTLSFLTWAFFLSEAIKSIPVNASGLAMSADVDEHARAPHNDESAPQSLSDDAAAYSDWNVANNPDGSIPLALNPDAAAVVPDLKLPEVGNVEGPAAVGKFDVAGGEAAGASSALSAADDAPVTTGGLPGGVLAVAPGLGGLAVNLDLGDVAGVHLNVGLPQIGEALGGIVGSSVVTLEHVLETPAQALSAVTTVVSSLVNNISELASGVVGSGGLVDVVGNTLGNVTNTLGNVTNELFSGGKYTDYHLALQTGDGAVSLALPTTSGVADALADVGGAVGGLVSAATHITNSDHGFHLPSAVDELVLRGSVEIGI